MTKSELMDLVGKSVFVYFKNGKKIYGKLGFADEFSERHGYKKTDFFYVEHTSFKVSHIKKITVINLEKRKPCINYSDQCAEWDGCPCVYYKAESEE